MAYFNGSEVLLMLNGTVVGHQRDSSISLEADQLDASNKGSNGFDESIKGRKRGSNDFDFVLVAPEGEGTPKIELSQIIDMVLSNDPVTLRQPLNPTGTHYLEGNAHLFGVSVENPDNDVATASGSLTFTGAITHVKPT